MRFIRSLKSFQFNSYDTSYRQSSLLVYIIVNFLFFWGCAAPGRITEHYTSSNSGEKIQQRIEDLNYEKAKTSLYGLEQFIRKYPRSRHVNKAKRGILSYLQCGEEWKSYALEIANFTDISGALYDSNSGFIYIIGDKVTHSKKRLPLPPLLLDDIMMIFKVIGRNEFPGVSIEPAQGMYSKTGVDESTHTVRYIPKSTRDTHLGSVLFEIDRQLKSLSHGKDTISNEPIGISGQKYIPEHELADISDTSPGFFGRIWFKHKKTSIVHEGNKIWFEEYKMAVLAESEDPAPRFFASHLEINYDEISKDIPAFSELIRIGKIVALATWMKENGTFIGSSILNNYTFIPIKTPRDTPVLKGIVGTKKIVKGNEIFTQEQYLVGGVNLATRNDYESFNNTSLSTQLKNEIKYYWSDVIDKVKSSPNKISWDISKGEDQYSVVRFPLTKKSLRETNF